PRARHEDAAVPAHRAGELPQRLRRRRRLVAGAWRRGAAALAGVAVATKSLIPAFGSLPDFTKFPPYHSRLESALVREEEPMASYALRRVLGAIPTLFIIITLAFFMMRLAPGGPFDSQRHLPPEIERNVAAAYDLDKPLYEQYFLYLDHLAHGDLGPSYKIKDFTVGHLIADGLPASATPAPS